MVNFQDQFVAYGEYHHDEVNQLVHCVFVPVLMWTLLAMIPYVSVYIVAIYLAYYLVLWPLVALLYSPILGLMLYTSLQTTLSTRYLLSLHVFSWVMQILSHKYFEKRAPAFLDDPLQAIVAAPLFVFCEVLFYFGFFPKVRAELNAKIQNKLDKLKSKQ